MKFCLYVAAILLGATCTFACEPLEFVLDGVTHNETVETVGNLVVLEDVADDFIVFLDYDRDLLTIKNTTAPEVCYFGTLSNTPFTRDHIGAVFVTENDGQAYYEAGTVLSVVKGGPICFKDVKVAAKVNELCCGVPSFEMILTEGTHARSARGARGGDGTTVIIINNRRLAAI